MSSKIENVEIEDASIDKVLAITGICTCIAILITLDDNRLFLLHLDSSCINLENTESIGYEVQKLIKKSISMFKKRENKKDSSFRNIFVIGGLNDNEYRSFNDELHRMKQNHSKTKPIIEGLNVDELQNFLKCIVYSNTILNLASGVDVDKAAGNTFMTDTSVVDDFTRSPPLLFIAQYYDLEQNLNGGYRIIEPYIFLTYNFNNNMWSIITNQLFTAESAHMNEILARFNPIRNTEHTKDELMAYIR